MSELQKERKSNNNTETEELAGIFSGITSIRALAIIAVMWAHYGINFGSITGPNLIIHGLQEIADVGVDLFVFLSGMLFTINMFLRNSQEHSWKNWYKRRIIRIYPLLIISTLIYLLPYLIFLGEFFSTNSVLMHMSGLQSFPTNSNYFLFASAHWYITFILSCYILFPLLYYSIRKNFIITAILGISLYLLFLFSPRPFFEIPRDFLYYNFDKSLYSWAFSLFFLRYFEFFFGILLGFLIGKYRKKVIKVLEDYKLGIFTFVSLVILITLYINFHIFSYTFLEFERILFYPLISIFSVLFFLNLFSKIPKINKILEYPGNKSYEIFLLHQAVIMIFYYLIIESFLIPDNLIFHLIFFPIVVILCLLIAYPFNKLNNYLRNEPKSHKGLLVISLSLIFYGIVFYSFGLELLINNLSSIILYLSILIMTTIYFLINH